MTHHKGYEEHKGKGIGFFATTNPFFVSFVIFVVNMFLSNVHELDFEDERSIRRDDGWEAALAVS